MIVRYMAGVFFTDMGVREAYLGFLNFLGIPWNLKFLWAPLVDYYSSKRAWIIAIEAIVTVGILIIAGLSLGIDPAAPSPQFLQLIVYVLIALAFISATHDVAIDAYYLTVLDKQEQALYNGDRVLSYRISVIFVKSILVAAAAFIGWSGSWLIAALTMCGILGFHAWYLPQPEGANVNAGQDAAHMLKHFSTAFRTYLDQPRVIFMLLFIIGYKLGDEIMFSMNTPFLLRELGITKVQLSWVSGILGTIGTVVGAMAGSIYISRVGLKRAIWPLTLLMNINIWAYVALSVWKPDPSTLSGISWISFVHTYEQLAAGLGNAVLMIYLMRTCKVEFKAAHYAVGSALMSVGSTLFGGFGGVLVENVGYTWLYIIGFLAAIPAMILIFFIPHLEDVKN